MDDALAFDGLPNPSHLRNLWPGPGSLSFQNQFEFEFEHEGENEFDRDSRGGLKGRLRGQEEASHSPPERSLREEALIRARFILGICAPHGNESLMRFWLLCACSIPLFVPSAARAEKFKYGFRPGQVIESRAGMAGASIMGPSGGDLLKMQFRVSIKQTLRVLSVAGGVVTLEVTDKPLAGKMTAMGRTQDYDRTTTKSVVRITQRGKFLSRKEVPAPGTPAFAVEAEAGAPDEMDGADALFGLNFPDRDLKPGDTWRDTITVGSRESPTKVLMTCRYVGRETVFGRKCAKFTSTVTHAPADEDPALAVPGLETQGRFTASQTCYFDPAAGIEVYSSGWMTTTMRTDFSALSPEGGELVSATRINVVQYLASAARKGK